MSNSSNEAYIYINPTNAFGMTDTSAGDLITFVNNSNQTIAFGACNNNSLMQLKSSNIYIKNKVGINTSNPQYTVDVQGDINFTGNLLVNSIAVSSLSTTVDSNNLLLSSTTGISILNSNLDSCIPKWSSLPVNGSNNSTYVTSVVVDNENNTIVCGHSLASNILMRYPVGATTYSLSNPMQTQSNYFAFIMKYDSNGSNLFGNVIGNSSNVLTYYGHTFAYDVGIDSSNDIYVCGTYYGSNIHVYSSNVLTPTGIISRYSNYNTSNYSKGYVSKISKLGVPQWVVNFEHNHQSTSYAPIVCNKLAIQQNGDYLYTSLFYESHNFNSFIAPSTAQANANNFSGYIYQNIFTIQVYTPREWRGLSVMTRLLKSTGIADTMINSSQKFNISIACTYFNGIGSYPSNICTDNSGNVTMTAHPRTYSATNFNTTSNTVTNRDIGIFCYLPYEYNTYIVQHDSNHNINWVAAMNITGQCSIMKADSTGSIYIAGYTTGSLNTYNSITQKTPTKTLNKTGFSAGSYIGFISKWDQYGNNSWNTKVDGYGDCYTTGLSIDSNNNLFISGWTSGDKFITYNSDGSYGYTDNAIATYTTNNKTLYCAKYDTNGMNYWSTDITACNKDLGCNIVISTTSNTQLSNFEFQNPRIAVAYNGSNFIIATSVGTQFPIYAFDPNNSNMISTGNPTYNFNIHMAQYNLSNNPYKIISNLTVNDSGFQKALINTTPYSIPINIMSSNTSNNISGIAVPPNANAHIYWFKDKWLTMN